MSDEPRPGQSIDHKTASGDPPGDDPGNSSAGQPINPPELPLQPGRKGGRWWLWKLLPVALLLAVGLVLIVTLGVAQRTGWITAGGGRTGGASAEEGVIYTCPMHPQIRQPTPGKCPICRMVLVPAVASGGNLEQMAVTIEPAQRRLAGIETAPAVLEPVLTRVETIGEVMIDESLIATVPAYVAGRIEELFADYTGVEVEKGDHLAVLYSPNLYSAQVEYLEARRAVESTSSAGLESVRRVQERLVTSSRQRLVELGMAADSNAGTVRESQIPPDDLHAHRRYGSRKTGGGRQVGRHGRTDLPGGRSADRLADAGAVSRRRGPNSFRPAGRG